MANKALFKSIVGKLVPAATATNHAGAPAYAYEPRHALAQLAATGTLGRTFYAEPEAQLEAALKLVCEIEPEFVAKTAIYARQRGHMKDLPALLLAALSAMHGTEFARAFPRIVDNGRMLRNFVQIMRSGVTGRKSLGTRPKKLVQGWLDAASDAEILRASVGQDPSLGDVIKMVHPRPASAERAALFGWLIGRPYDVAAAPEIVRAFEAFKADPTGEVPDLPFQMLTSLPLTKEQWAGVGRKAGWHMLRMNLNTFARHGAFEVEGFAEHVAERLRDGDAIRRARVFPYQLMAAYAATGSGVPAAVREALQDAMEIAVSNVPAVAGNVVVCPDVSGSMGSPATGYRPGATSVVRCVDVAALVAAAFLRANRTARVMPFEQDVVDVDLNPRDSVMTNAGKLAAVGGGGTNCSAPVERLVAEKARVDLLVFVSDNQSWMDAQAARSGTGLMQAFNRLKAINPGLKMVCVDIQPYGATQAVEREDILNVGGFSDAAFEMIGRFADGTLGPAHWVGEIEKIEL
ncbi:60 kDa SS-A/Ro ribonucleoprotein [Methylopila capsulata]|uniref:Ribonucleoprotein n=1 Tax=Methylopila capsulata TaxID=61654 RepID=A0A9W6MTN0_9HYPH|nr:RNA-binding protein [Methylopila capsulata]MBM7853504.1 60 kDa SS-A/Ro ribonucleoprotein [Methylopila capsulata]GLK57281.1 ribonucleoprotein [Methylopila capsulata]